MALNQVDVDEFVETIKTMAPSFAGIHLEDIAAPRVFEIEKRLNEELISPFITMIKPERQLLS